MTERGSNINISQVIFIIICCDVYSASPSTFCKYMLTVAKKKLCGFYRFIIILPVKDDT